MTLNNCLFILCAAVTFSIKSFAFPEMIRRNYVNCSSCHVSQTGGGILNSYGRSISYEVLSTWGSAEEARAFYAIDSDAVTEWLNVGGDVRVLQWHYEDENIKIGKGFLMQAELAFALTVEKWTAMMAVGKVDTIENKIEAVSPKYYLSYQASDEFSVRIGRTIPVYGLQIPQHNFFIKDRLLIGEDTERDNVESFWIGEDWNFSLGLSKSNKESKVKDVENAVSGHMARSLGSAAKVGFSIWNGDATAFKRTMIGIDAAVGFTEKVYLLSEIDHVSRTTKSSGLETKSIYELFKLGIEFKKGIHAQFVQQYGKPDVENAVEIQSYGAGVLWYPRPHFEVEFLWQKQRILGSFSPAFTDYAYLLAHFYF